MRAYANDARSSAVGSHFTRFKKEIHPALGPFHTTIALRKRLHASQAVLKLRQQLIEAI
jgi:hypothetical protein